MRVLSISVVLIIMSLKAFSQSPGFIYQKKIRKQTVTTEEIREESLFIERDSSDWCCKKILDILKESDLTKSQSGRDCEKTDPDFDLGAIPEAISTFSSASVIPSLKMQGSRTGTGPNGVIHQMDLYIAKEPTLRDSLSGDETREVLSRNLWIPEASSFFFKYQFVKPFAIGRNVSNLKKSAIDDPCSEEAKELLTKRTLMIGGTFYYLNKEIPELNQNGDSTLSLQNSGFGQFETNISYLIPDRNNGSVLARIYADYSFIFGINKVDEFQEYFGLNTNRVRDFFKIGVEVGLSQNSNTNFYIDLGMIIQTRDVDRIRDNSDIAIPVIKFKLVPSYSKFIQG